MPFEVMNSHMSEGPREAWPSIRRGLQCRCPACGVGPMFGHYLKTNPICDNCGEELFHEQAHDFPPYITISVVAHIVLMGIVLAEQNAEWSYELHLMIWVPLTIVLTFALMQPIKGAVIGYQWARRMHGFGGGDEAVADRAALAARLREQAAKGPSSQDPSRKDQST